MATLEVERVLPAEADYPAEIFRPDLPPELRVGCARAYFKTNFVARRLFRKRVQITLDLIPQRQYDRALDAGTGAGYLLPALATLADRVEGVDLSPVMRYTQGMLDKRGIRNVTLREADLLNLPFDPATFDLLVCLSVIEHIPDPAAAFGEMGRVLRNDGVLIVGYPLEHALFRFLEWLLHKERRVRTGQSAVAEGQAFHPHVSHYSRIEQGFAGIFRADARRDVGLFGMPVYRILRLVKE